MMVHRIRRPLVITIGIILLISVMMLLVACGGGQTASTTGTPADTTNSTTKVTGDEVEELKIGVLSSVTGDAAMTGVEDLWAKQQAAKDINAQGGINVGGKMMKIKLVVADDKSLASEAAAAMERLIKVEGCKLILSSQPTPLNVAAGTVAEKYKVLYCCNTSWIDLMSLENFSYVSSIFFTVPGAASVPFEIMNLQPEAERPVSIAVVVQDNPDGQGLGGVIQQLAVDYGYNITVYEPYTPGTKDFSSVILMMKQAECDAMLWFGTPTDSVTIIRDIKAANLNLKYNHGWMGYWTNEFANIMGKDADYIMHDGFWTEHMPYANSAELGAQYASDNNGRDSAAIGLAYANAMVLFRAIERAGTTDPEKVRDEIYGGTFEDTPVGTVVFDDQGMANIPPLGIQWIDGERHIVWPTDLSDGYELQWIPPWDERE